MNEASLRRRLRSGWVAGIFALVLLVGPTLLAGEAAAARPRPPETRRDNVKEMLHGVELTDPYRWLEDQDAPETRAWVEAQNKFTDSQLAPWPGREALRQRLTALLKIDLFGVPVARNGRYFFTKRRADQDLPVLYLRRGVTGEDEVLLDPHPLSEDHRTTIVLQDVSEDGALIAYGVRQGGEDEIAIKLMEVETRKDLPDTLPRARYFGVSIKPDKSGCYYTRHEAEGSRLYYHALGADPA
ncbi:MAG: prolyl oligopeptidase family serine peptidase, partial [Candidatus Acidiferrales bacterium]